MLRGHRYCEEGREGERGGGEEREREGGGGGEGVREGRREREREREEMCMCGEGGERESDRVRNNNYHVCTCIPFILLKAPFLSSYVTQCFQHIYFATSTLWGADGGGSVFGSDSLEFTRGMASFR